MTPQSPSTRFDPGPLAIGTAPLGGLYAPVSDADAAGALQRAADSGITHFDTAPHYGRGLAEERLGAFLASVDHPERFTVSTKVGRDVVRTAERAAGDMFTGAPPGESVFDFSPTAIRRQLDASRARLGRDRIDLVLLHDPDDHLDAALAAAEGLASLRDTGRIGAIGVGTNSAGVADHLLDRVDLDAVLLAGRITLLETSGEATAARCARQGVLLLAAGVFQSGILAGEAGGTYDYGPAPEAIRDRVAQLGVVCDRFGVSLRTVAANHPRRITGVTTTLVGVRSAAEVADAVGDHDTTLPAELWDEIDTVRATWTEAMTNEGAHP